MNREAAIDFAFVRPEHLAIHLQLLNWAQWCGGRGGGTSVHPMFREYRDSYHEASVRPTECDSLAALATQRAYIQLPEVNRWVLNWAYCKPFIPVLKVRRALGLSTPDLADSIHRARTMMKNTRS